MKVPPRWTLKNLRQIYLSKMITRVETDECVYEEWVYE